MEWLLNQLFSLYLCCSLAHFTLDCAHCIDRTLDWRIAFLLTCIVATAGFILTSFCDHSRLCVAKVGEVVRWMVIVQKRDSYIATNIVLSFCVAFWLHLVDTFTFM